MVAMFIPVCVSQSAFCMLKPFTDIVVVSDAIVCEPLPSRIVTLAGLTILGSWAMTMFADLTVLCRCVFDRQMLTSIGEFTVPLTLGSFSFVSGAITFIFAPVPVASIGFPSLSLTVSSVMSSWYSPAVVPSGIVYESVITGPVPAVIPCVFPPNAEYAVVLSGVFCVAPLIPPSSLAPFVAVEKVIGLLSIIFAENPHIGASFCRFKVMPTVCPGSPVVGDSVNVIAALALVAIIIISNSVVLFISFFVGLLEIGI